jgi:alpha-beta hydrolase superfamily lysophospholipase
VNRRRTVLAVTLLALGAGACMPPTWGANALLHPKRRPMTRQPNLPFEAVEFEGTGVKLRGWWFHAREKRGTVVFLHGLSDNRGTSVGVADHFVARGFEVIAYDSRAHGESEGEACTYGFYEKQDLRRVLDRVTAGPIVVMGTSMGAAIALQAAAEDQRIAAVVAVSSFSDLRTAVIERVPFFATKSDVARAFEMAEVLGKFRIDDVSPVAAAARINAPTLLVHGERDDETPPDHSQRIFAALHAPKRLILVPNAGHSHLLNADVWREIDRWVDSALRAKAAAAPRPPAAAPADIDVLDYDVALDIDRDRKRIAGRERVTFRSAKDGLAVVAFPRNGIAVTSVASPAGAPLAHTESPDAIEIRLPAPLARGQTGTIAFAYETTAPKGVAFRADAIYSSFFTCHWMICRDRPEDKATLTLSIEAPDGLSVVANGVPGESKSAVAGRRRTTWKEQVPSSPYLFGFAIGKFVRTERQRPGTTFEYYAADGDSHLLEAGFADDDRMLAFFVGKAGRPLPRPFYRQVVVDGSVAQEMSSFSLLGRALLDARVNDPTEDWAVAHEMAHQFWGNMITCADWSHGWLNEGLTVFMVAAYKEQRWGRAAYERELKLARDRHQLAVDAGMDVPLAFAGDYPSLRLKRAVTYSKAFLFLDRLRQAMGDRTFWSALERYTRELAGRAVVSQDFERVFAADTHADVAGLFRQWVYEER